MLCVFLPLEVLQRVTMAHACAKQVAHAGLKPFKGHFRNAFPHNASVVRRFRGLPNQVVKFVPNFAELLSLCAI